MDRRIGIHQRELLRAVYTRQVRLVLTKRTVHTTWTNKRQVTVARQWQSPCYAFQEGGEEPTYPIELVRSLIEHRFLVGSTARGRVVLRGRNILVPRTVALSAEGVAFLTEAALSAEGALSVPPSSAGASV